MVAPCKYPVAYKVWVRINGEDYHYTQVVYDGGPRVVKTKRGEFFGKREYLKFKCLEDALPELGKEGE